MYYTYEPNGYDEDLECSVCLEKTVSSTTCNHKLCKKCFTKLVTKVCPICRENIDTRPQININQITPMGFEHNNNNIVIYRTDEDDGEDEEFIHNERN